MATIGYVRVSAFQTEEGSRRQRNILLPYGCDEIVEERTSSVLDKRAALSELIGRLAPGDTLIVVHLDRLARSASDFLQLVDDVRKKGAAIQIVDIGFASETPEGREFIRGLVPAADLERQTTQERRNEEISKAQARGKFRGQAPTAAKRAADVLRLRAEGRSGNEIAALLKIGRSSVFRILADPELAERIASGEEGASWNVKAQDAN